MDEERMPKQLQDKLAQFQTLQQQLQIMSLQKQQMVMQNGEMENAQKELSAIKTGKVYRIIGPILVETTKEETEKKLKDDFDLNKTRIEVLEKQEKKLAEKLNEMRSELQSMISGAQRTA
ncbi:MAG: prefoldin subunit beta [Candidatus Altiarchaeota archaeon]|nr:prefoldin subunit beta [Candidatus Altiarchaeota archaeon]